MNILLAALILAYPFAAHASLSTGTPWAPWLLATIVLVEAARLARRRPGISALLVLLSAALVLTATKFAETLIRLPPVLLPLMLALLFGLSLLPGRTALITRFAEVTEGPLPGNVRRYTRRVTWLWVLVFLALALEATLLALLVAPQLWSLFTNCLNYLFVALVFVVEFAVRRHYFPERTRGGLLTFMGRIARVEWGRLGRYDTPER